MYERNAVGLEKLARAWSKAGAPQIEKATNPKGHNITNIPGMYVEIESFPPPPVTTIFKVLIS
jgi:hypothetical protein